LISENKLLSSKHWIREWVSQRPGLNAAKKRIFLRGQLTNKTTDNISAQTQTSEKRTRQNIRLQMKREW